MVLTPTFSNSTFQEFNLTECNCQAFKFPKKNFIHDPEQFWRQISNFNCSTNIPIAAEHLLSFTHTALGQHSGARPVTTVDLPDVRG
jgi:hypothetical protein